MNALDRILSEPWCILPSAVPSMLAWFDATLYALKNPLASEPERIARLASTMRQDDPAAPERDWLADYVIQRPPLAITPEGLGIVSVTGPLARGLTKIEKRLGASDYNEVIADMRAAAGDERCRAIVLDVNSPGGSMVGVPETRDAIAAAAVRKPVVAFIESCGCSAAYSLATAADVIIGSPSAITGSIGTIATFADWSAFYEKLGVKISVITASESDLKSTWNPLAPMTKEQRADAQRQLDSANADFLDAVRASRPGVPDTAMRGQWFTAKDALPVHLIDQLGGKGDAADAAMALANYRTRAA